MLTLQKHTLQHALLQLLARHPFATALWLQKRASTLYKPCSIQAVYKELRTLISRGIVVKEGEQFSLSLSWLLNSSAFLDEAFDCYMRQSSQSGSPEPRAGRQSWSFSDLRKTDDFWIQKTLQLLQEARGRAVYGWIPFPWFDLIHHDKDVLFQNALRAMGCKAYFVMKRRGFLSERSALSWPQDVYIWRFDAELFPKTDNQYLHVIGDSILTIKLDKKATAAVSDYYLRIDSLDKLSPAGLMDLVLSRFSCTVSVERNETKAARLARKFSRFFGIKEGTQSEPVSIE